MDIMQPVPVLCYRHGNQMPSHIQLELPASLFVVIASCLVTRHHQKESGSSLLTPSLVILVHIDEIPSRSSILQAEQAQLSQPPLAGQMLQSPYLSWTHSSSSMSMVLGSPELDAALQVRPPQG